MTKTNQETRHRATENNHCHPEIRGPGRMSRWTTYFWDPWISTTGDAVRMLAERWYIQLAAESSWGFGWCRGSSCAKT